MFQVEPISLVSRSRMNLMKVIGIVGMPGSGKSEAADVARSMGIPVIVMGDVVRKGVAESGQEINSKTLRSMMIELRKEYGKGVVAERCLPEIRSHKSEDIVVVDGLRSLNEAEAFRLEIPDFTIVAIHSSPKTRYNRLRERRRKDDPSTWEEFKSRDRLELRIGIGDVIALADVVVSNEGAQSDFRKNIMKIIATGKCK
jgi:dephospho-CoA kinase